MKRGVAYGFFNCRASKPEIEAELPTIRDLAQTPNQLELTLTEGVENLPVQRDSALRAIVQQAQDANLRYVMQAQLPGATNTKEQQTS